MNVKILLIEDDPLWQLTLSALLASYGHVECVSSASEAIARLSKDYFDITFIDLDLEERLIGLEVLKVAKQKGIYNVVVSSNEGEEIIDQGYIIGCMDYLSKPVSEKGLELVFQKFSSLRNHSRVQKELTSRFVTHNPQLIDTLDIIKNINLSQKSILLTGESGTGKSHLAKIIHDISNFDKKHPFIALNCSQFNEMTIDSELFGHVKGSFTGAIRDKLGLIEKAADGTLFLDEIHSLSLKSQQKLLTALDTGVIYPVGSETPKKVHFRVICATCEPIEELVVKREFRKDLYYRIKTFVLNIPSLKERKEDIIPLFQFYLNKKERKMILTESAKSALINYHYPANTREIEDLVENWSVMGLGRIDHCDLPSYIQANTSIDSPGLTPMQIERLKLLGLKQFIDEVKKEAITHILEEGQSQSQVAKILGVSRSMISKEMTKLGIGNHETQRLTH